MFGGHNASGEEAERFCTRYKGVMQHLPDSMAKMAEFSMSLAHVKRVERCDLPRSSDGTTVVSFAMSQQQGFACSTSTGFPSAIDRIAAPGAHVLHVSDGQ